MSKGVKAATKSSMVLIVLTWVGALLSAGLLFFTSSVLTSDFGSLRSCSVNTGLTMSNCGKQSINSGDFMLFILFVLSAVLVVTLFTHAWRMSRGRRD